MVGQDGRSDVPALTASGTRQADPGDGTRPARARAPRRWRLRNWRMRWRVLALVVIPTAAALALGALRIGAAQEASAAASRTAQLGMLGTDITALAEAVQDERDLTAGYVAARQAGEKALA